MHHAYSTFKGKPLNFLHLKWAEIADKKKKILIETFSELVDEAACLWECVCVTKNQNKQKYICIQIHHGGWNFNDSHWQICTCSPSLSLTPIGYRSMLNCAFNFACIKASCAYTKMPFIFFWLLGLMMIFF